MRMYDLIEKKRDGGFLNKEEIEFIIEGFTNGSIPDYQMSAFLMSVYFKGMDEKETYYLTMAMVNSGQILDMSDIEGIKVDKHSTGGVGDKTTLVLAPMVAACGVPVAKMSGRGLGHTGGTIDKLESFPGFDSSISINDFIKNVNDIKIAIAGQTKNLAPADKKIYALRDVTATVNSIPLIAGSIMSKKLASGSDGIVLDVKCGNGAFMNQEKDAEILANEMVNLGKNAGKKTIALITDMNQPLGNAVGNTLEVIEAIESLKGNGPQDLMELCYNLGVQMLIISGIATNNIEAKDMLEGVIKSGKALNKLEELIKKQGGDSSYIYNTDLFKRGNIVTEVYLDEEGYVKSIETQSIGTASLILGGGRITKESEIDLSVGVVIHKKIGDKVNKNESISTVYGNDEIKVSEAVKIIKKSYSISKERIEKPKLIKKIIN